MHSADFFHHSVKNVYFCISYTLNFKLVLSKTILINRREILERNSKHHPLTREREKRDKNRERRETALFGFIVNKKGVKAWWALETMNRFNGPVSFTSFTSPAACNARVRGKMYREFSLSFSLGTSETGDSRSWVYGRWLTRQWKSTKPRGADKRYVKQTVLPAI